MLQPQDESRARRLSAMGMSKDQIESTVRLSFCEENTMEEADYFLADYERAGSDAQQIFKKINNR